MSRVMKCCACIFFCMIGTIWLFIGVGIRINLSDSIPKGVYRITSESTLANHYIIFCPELNKEFQRALHRGYISKGLCTQGFGYLMKKVVALHGDLVSSNAEGIFVNNKLLPFSKPLSQDGIHRPLSAWTVRNYQLKQDEVLTMTNQSSVSFDGRYYGLIHLGKIQGIIKPLFIW